MENQEERPSNEKSAWKGNLEEIQKKSPELLHALQSLLGCTELNLDEMEPETRVAVVKAHCLVKELDNYKQPEPQFPNGFTSWTETFFQVSAFIISHMQHFPEGSDAEEDPVREAQLEGGQIALTTLAESWTSEFEQLHEGRQWDGEFFDEIDSFCRGKMC